MIEVPPTIFLLLFCPDLIKNVFNLHFFDENENLDRLYNLQAYPKWITIYFYWDGKGKGLIGEVGGGRCFLEIWILDQG